MTKYCKCFLARMSMSQLASSVVVVRSTQHSHIFEEHSEVLEDTVDRRAGCNKKYVLPAIV